MGGQRERRNGATIRMMFQDRCAAREFALAL
jgi:hypothetical protein